MLQQPLTNEVLDHELPMNPPTPDFRFSSCNFSIAETLPHVTHAKGLTRWSGKSCRGKAHSSVSLVCYLSLCCPCIYIRMYACVCTVMCMHDLSLSLNI